MTPTTLPEPARRLAVLGKWKCPNQAMHKAVERIEWAQDFSYTRCGAYIGIGTETRECGELARYDLLEARNALILALIAWGCAAPEKEAGE